MRAMRLRSELEVICSHAERDLAGLAEQFDSMHGSVMPRPYVGKDYGKAFDGVPVPKILMMSINQSREKNHDKNASDFDPDKVRDSLYEGPFGEGGKISSNGYGPRLLALNLARWLFVGCEVKGLNFEHAGKICDLIAYDNFVKWPFDVDNSEPPEKVWPVFYGLNRTVIETLQPDIILCLGHPMYDHLCNAAKEKKGPKKKLDWSRGYRWFGKDDGNEYARPGWCGELKSPWGQCQFGWVYHYSNPIWPNKVWKEVQEGEGKPPRNIGPLLKVKDTQETFEKQVRHFGEDDQDDAHEFPWWGSDKSTDSGVAKYNPYQKFVAHRVCEVMVGGWKNRSGNTADK
jgi:hypothetical protein